MNLDENKTDKPRTWPMYAGVRDALKLYLKRYRPNAKSDEYLFIEPAGRRAARRTDPGACR